MSGAIEFAGGTAALEVTNSSDVPERFSLFFKADGTRIPCHVIWRQDERVGAAFD